MATTLDAAAPGPAPVTGSDILDASGVVKTYRTGALEVEALRGVDLRIPRGQYLSVMGPSGARVTPIPRSESVWPRFAIMRAPDERSAGGGQLNASALIR